MIMKLTRPDGEKIYIQKDCISHWEAVIGGSPNSVSTVYISGIRQDVKETPEHICELMK